MPLATRYAFFEGAIVPIEAAKVSIMISGLNYGTGVFEGIRAYWNAEAGQLYVFRLPEHFERFLRNLRTLMIDIPYSVDQLCALTVELLQREAFQTDVYIRPLAYKSTPGIGVRLYDLDSQFSMFALPFGAYHHCVGGARVAVSSWRRLDDNSIPPRNKITGGYVNSALAKTEAHLNGFDDAIVLGADGHVSEGSAANVFLVRDGRLVTPPITDNILEGITRATITELGRSLGIETTERSIDRSELYVADEVFLCGTGVGLMPVVEVDRKKVGHGQPGPVASKLHDLYYATVRGTVPRYQHWLTAVYPVPAKVEPRP